jgi:hypothetical protein
MARSKTTALALLLATWTLTTTGCFWGFTTGGPSLGILAVPIPISPYFQDQKEDEYWEHERYERVPILGPVTEGGPPIALDPPSDDEVMRALEKVHPVEGGVPCLWERNRNNVRITKCKIADYVDPPRVYPLICPAQQPITTCTWLATWIPAVTPSSRVAKRGYAKDKETRRTGGKEIRVFLPVSLSPCLLVFVTNG